MSPISPRSSPTARDGVALKSAMVFAAGLGKRMRPLTNTIPKPLVKVAGKALIDYMLDDLAQAGVEHAVVNVHHLPDQIENHLALRKSPRIVISDERERLLDQGGGIKKALSHFGDKPFFICNTDAFWKEAGVENIRKLAQAWDAEAMDALLLLANTKGNVGVDWDGDFEMDAEGRLSQPQGPRAYVYSGVGVIKPEPFANFAEEAFRLAPFFFEAQRRGRLFGVASSALWLHVGTVAAIEDAERALKTNPGSSVS